MVSIDLDMHSLEFHFLFNVKAYKNKASRLNAEKQTKSRKTCK